MGKRHGRGDLRPPGEVAGFGVPQAELAPIIIIVPDLSVNASQ